MNPCKRCGKTNPADIHTCTPPTDIIRMAQEAGDDWEHTLPDDRAFLERFAALVAAAEREACALICHELKMQNKFQNADDQYDDWNHGIAHGAELCRDAIRSRNNT
jgi:acyl-CoA reductase-like NAD-dependent aldehyde dehydrogenase